MGFVKTGSYQQRCLGLARLALLLVLAGFSMLDVEHARASIAAQGSVSPIYNGVDDPWMVESLSVNSSTGSSYGVVSISNDSIINVSNTTYVLADDAHVGRLDFDSGILSTGGLWASPEQLHGVGVIHTGSILSDIDLIFDGNHGLEQQITLAEQPGQSITINLNATSTSPVASLGVGYRGEGSLTVSDGITIASVDGILGYYAGSNGKALVTGEGTNWNVDFRLRIGEDGAGELMIESGASVSVVDRVAIGYGSARGNRSGKLFVSGPGSNLTSREILLGNGSGSSELRITNGALVETREQASIGYGFDAENPAIAVVSGPGSTWRLGTEDIGVKESKLTIGGAGPATLTIENRGLVVAPGGLKFNVVGRGGNQLNLASGGMLAIKSDLSDSLDGFFSGIDWASYVNHWDGFDWAPLASGEPGQDYTLEYMLDGELAGFTVLTVGFDPGDFNTDGLVDGLDYAVWCSQYGGTGVLSADGNRDGVVDAADYTVWRDGMHDDWTQNPTVRVPESSSYALACLGLLLTVSSRVLTTAEQR